MEEFAQLQFGFQLMGIATSLFIVLVVRYFIESRRDSVRRKLSKNYELVGAQIVDKEIGEYGGTRYFPYVEYVYIYNGEKYKGDCYSYPRERLFPSNIQVKKILDELEENDFKVYVRRDNPEVSYIYIDDAEIQHAYGPGKCHILLLYIPIAFVVMCAMGIYDSFAG